MEALPSPSPSSTPTIDYSLSPFSDTGETRLEGSMIGSGSDEFDFKTPLHHNDRLQPPPLKLPPCRQQAGNAECGARRPARRAALVGFDPFEAALESIRKDEASLSQRRCRRRALLFELISSLFRWKLRETKVHPVKSAKRFEVEIARSESARTRELKAVLARTIIDCNARGASIEGLIRNGSVTRYRRSPRGLNLLACFGGRR